MTKTVSTCVMTVMLMICAVAAAQDKPAAPAKAPAITPLKIQIVLSRYQGDKKISSLPYMITVNTNTSRTSLRMGADVPIVQKEGPSATFTYRSVGTSIDCGASTLDDGRFRLDLTIEDSSVYGDSQGAADVSNTASIAKRAGVEVPVFRAFRGVNVLTLRDGQAEQFTAATDKVSGEVLKVDVTLTVIK